MNSYREVWKQLVAPDSRNTLNMVLRRAAGSLSQLTNQVFSTDTAWIERIPLSEIMTQAGDPEAAMVGVYLQIEGGLGGHALLTLSTDCALQLVNSMLEQPPGTVTNLGNMENSALAEVGNLTVSYFLNAVADLVGGMTLLRPSPPAITVDMLGAIFNTVVIPLASVRDDLLVAGTTFKQIGGTMQIRFWIMPDSENQELLI
jgi:chemotaxis protein CheC